MAPDLLISVLQEHASCLNRALPAGAARARRDSSSSWGTDLTGVTGRHSAEATAEAIAGDGIGNGSDIGARLRAAANASYDRETRLKKLKKARQSGIDPTNVMDQARTARHRKHA